MPRVLWCSIHGVTAILLVDGQTLCADCRGPVAWREVEPDSVPFTPFTLTMMDRKLLKSFGIGTD